MILTQQLILNASKNLQKPALVYLGKEISYKTLLGDISRLSYLYQNELGQSIRMAYLCSNSPAMVATFFAMANIRAVNIPMNPDLTLEELATWVKQSKATHLAVTSDLVSKARDLLHTLRSSMPIIEIEKKRGGEYDASFTPPSDQTPKETDVVLLLRSAGITGKPKYVQFSHKQIAHTTMAIRNHYHLVETDRFLSTQSWSHPFPLVHHLLFPLMAHSTCVIDHGLQAAEFLKFIMQSRVTRLLGEPRSFLELLIVCKNEKTTLPGLKSITVGLGLLSAELKKTFDLLKIHVSHCYGQVENLWTIAMESIEALADDTHAQYVRGYVGKSLSGFKYKVLNSNGDFIEGKETRTGQLAVMSPTVMLGYLDQEKETKMVLRGTWLYTGDIVTLDGEGESLRITFLGRQQDVIQTEEGFVHLSKIDSILQSSPAVQDAAAFRAKNAKGHLALACAVVKKEGVFVNEKQIQEFCTTYLPPELRPAAIAFTDVIPRGAGGNINYSRLSSQFSGIFG